jgi:ribosomal protein S18 acetylase RimI-like enzyme
MTGAPDDAGLIEALTEYGDTDLDDLCDAATKAIADNGGFGWLKPPQRHVMENYWRGVLMVPERSLIVSRLDGVICGSAQLVRTPRNNEAQAFAAQLTTHFVAPWARRRGLGRRLVEAVEEAARAAGIAVLNLDVRATQAQAIALYERVGFERWGTHPAYARVEGAIVPGHYYLKRLDPSKGLGVEAVTS